MSLVLPLALNEFTQRRKNFIAQMPNNSVALFPAASEVTRSNDTEYLFCQNKNFYYLTGFNEPDAMLLLIKGAADDPDSCILFCREKDALAEVWQGRRVGPERAKEEYGFAEAFSLDSLEDELFTLFDGKERLLYCQGAFSTLESLIDETIRKLKAASRQGRKAPKIKQDCTDIIEDMRLFKSAYELELMQQANDISVKAHHRAMEKTRAGVYEYQIEAEILHEFTRHGARFAAYNSIVAGGDNANILHYTNNQDELRSGDLLLIDAGAEYQGYAADITRTFPVSGKFSEPQKALYQLVLAAQNAAIAAIKPQQTLAELNQIATDILTEGLHQLGILQGDLTELVAEKASKKYFIHGIGHWLGLDVHDVGDYHIDDDRKQQRAFEPGMVMTIEPGLYIPLDDFEVEEKWRGIGIRIEDNILVTADGYHNLSQAAVKTVADIEALMATKR